MTTYNDILFVISVISHFSLGFYLGRRNALGFLIASLVLFLSSLTSITLNGLYTYSGAILDVNVYEAVVAIIYIAFLWGLGYITSYFLLIKKDNICKVERMNIK